MAEYIEREAAIDALNKALFSYEDETEARLKNDPELDISEWFLHRIFVQNMNEIDRQTVLNIPAADVAPVVHARWLTKEYMYGDKSVGIDDAWIERVAEKGECAYCSNCKEYAKLDGAEEYALTPYCPNCGADMREVQHDD
jgi:hypothetical protein